MKETPLFLSTVSFLMFFLDSFIFACFGDSVEPSTQTPEFCGLATYTAKYYTTGLDLNAVIYIV